LRGLHSYSHLIVLYWLHQAAKASTQTIVHPGERSHLPKIGILAKRNTSYRPNKIGLAIVKLSSACSNIIKVTGLDAYNQSPVIDVKPFMHWDVPEGSRTRKRRVSQTTIILDFKARISVPEWWTRFQQVNPEKSGYKGRQVSEKNSSETIS